MRTRIPGPWEGKTSPNGNGWNTRLLTLAAWATIALAVYGLLNAKIFRVEARVQRTVDKNEHRSIENSNAIANINGKLDTIIEALTEVLK